MQARGSVIIVWNRARPRPLVRNPDLCCCVRVAPFQRCLSPLFVHCSHRLLVYHLHCYFGDISNGVCRVMKITMAETSPDIKFLTPPLNTSPGKNCTGFLFQNVLSRLYVFQCYKWFWSLNCCMSTLCLVRYALLLTPACWKSNNTNARLMAFASSLALDPTFGIHSHKILDAAQACHVLKPNWKPSSSPSISILTNISTQFLLQSLCVRACVRACVCACVCVCSAFFI